MGNPTVISTPNAGSAPNFTDGSYAFIGSTVNYSPIAGGATLYISLSGNGSGMSAHVYTTYDGIECKQSADASIQSVDGSVGAITANGLYEVQVGPGKAFLVFSALGGGQATVNLYLGPPKGPAGEAPGSNTVSITSPLNGQGYVEVQTPAPSDGLNETFTVVANTPTQLPSHVLTGQYAILRAPSTNAAPVMWGYVNNIGASIAAGNHASFILPGAAGSAAIANTNQIWYNSVNSSDLLTVEAA